MTALRDRGVRNVQLLGRDHAERRARGALAHLDLAGAVRDRVVRVDRQPVRELASRRAWCWPAAMRGLCADACADEAEADD